VLHDACAIISVIPRRRINQSPKSGTEFGFQKIALDPKRAPGAAPIATSR